MTKKKFSVPLNVSLVFDFLGKLFRIKLIAVKSFVQVSKEKNFNESQSKRLKKKRKKNK